KKTSGKREPTFSEEIEMVPEKEDVIEFEPIAEPEKPRIIEEPREEPVKEKKESVFHNHINQLSGTLSARLLDNGTVISEVPVRDLANALKDYSGNITSVVFDGVITQRIVDIASEKGVTNLIGAKIGNVVKSPASIHIEASNEL
ncbi:MAG: DNA primase, partial [Candidatus Methanoperedens sp.]|nr:DNA primase [Candidatus Methanoperedens sp.]